MLETTRLLRDLVSIPSVNPMGRALGGPDIYEHRVTDYLEAFFRNLGVGFERQTVAPQRDNIVAWIDLARSGPTLVVSVLSGGPPARRCQDSLEAQGSGLAEKRALP